MGDRVKLEDAPDLNVKQRERLATIWRRIKFLDHRIENHRGHPGRDAAEVAALRWLLELAELPEPPKENHG